MSEPSFFAARRGLDEQDERRAATARRRVAAQHVLRNYAPLLVGPLSAGGDVDGAMRSRRFQEDVVLCRDVAVRIYAKATGRDPASVRLSDVRAIRNDVVGLVAGLRERGASVDPDAVVDAVVEALDAVDAEFDAETFRWADMSDRGSAAITASHAAMALMRATSTYDFRLGAKEALGRCVDAVARAAGEAVPMILGGEGTAEDRRSLTQSLVRDLSRLLVARYEATARRTVDAVLGHQPASRAAYLAATRPFEAVLVAFRSDAEAFVAQVVKATAVQAGEEASLERDRGIS